MSEHEHECAKCCECECVCVAEEESCETTVEEVDCSVPEDVEGDPQYLLSGPVVTPNCYYLGAHRVEGRLVEGETGTFHRIIDEDTDVVLDRLDCREFIYGARMTLWRAGCPTGARDEGLEVGLCAESHRVQADGEIQVETCDLIGVTGTTGTAVGEVIASGDERCFLPSGGVLLAKVRGADMRHEVVKVQLFTVPEKALKSKCCPVQE